MKALLSWDYGRGLIRILSTEVLLLVRLMLLLVIQALTNQEVFSVYAALALIKKNETMAFHTYVIDKTLLLTCLDAHRELRVLLF